MPPAKTTRSANTTQATSTRNRTTSGKTVKSTNANSQGSDDVDALAGRMTGTLRLNATSSVGRKPTRTTSTTVRTENPHSKSTAENVPVTPKLELSPTERGKHAMRTVNSTMQSLVEAIQKGWKAPHAQSKPTAPIRSRALNKQEDSGEGVCTLESITSTAAKCRSALSSMRGLKDQVDIKPVDIERAAVNVAGKLLGLEMWTLVLEFLTDSRPSVLDLYEHLPLSARITKTSTPAVGKSRTGQRVPSSRSVVKESTSFGQHCELLLFPTPSDPDNIDVAALNVIASSQLYALTSLVHLVNPASIRELSQTLAAPGNMLDFVPVLQTRLGSKFYSSLALSTFRAIATRLSSSEAHSPDVLFSVRLWALRCFIQADGINGNDFWDQTMRWAASYLKTIPSGSKDQEKAASAQIMTVFSELVDRAGARPDGRDFANGASFGKMCDWWISLARRSGNLEILTTVNNILASTSTTATSIKSSSNLDTRVAANESQGMDDAGMLLSKIYARVSHVEALVSKLAKDGDDKGVEDHLDAILSDIRHLRRLYTSGVDGVHRLQRETERLRHSCAKLLEKTLEASLSGGRLRPACIAVLESLIDVAESTSTPADGDSVPNKPSAEFQKDMMSGALDSLLTLARVVLSPTQHLTYSLALGYLERAHKLTTSIPSGETVQYLRCLGAAHQNAAAVLYKHNKAEFAIRFAEQAYLISVQMFEASDGANNEGSALREQLGRRAEILASCYLKQGDRKLAYRSYCDALSWISFNTISALQSTLAKESVFASFAAQPTVSALIERVTRLAVSDLLLPPKEASLRHQLEGRAVPTEVIGGLLEYQILTMDNMLHKPECLPAISNILDELLNLYAPDIFPIRRSRVLLRNLEHLYHIGSNSSALIASDILEGFVGENKANDAGLAGYIPLYQAFTHVWLAIQSHGNADSPSMPAVVQHTDEAVRIFRQVFIPGSVPKPRSASPKSRSLGKGPSKPRPAQTPKTPARGRRAVSTKTPKVTTSLTLSNDRATITSAALDNVERLYKHLELLSDLLKFLVLSFQRIDLLEIMRHFNQHRIERSLSCDEMLRTTTELAYENARLGKTGRASHLYAQAMNCALHDDCTTPLSDSARILYLLRYASSLVIHGNLEKSSSLYQEALETAAAMETDGPNTTVGRIRTRTLVLEQAAIASSVYALIKDEQDDMPSCLNALEQSLRLWNRAMDNVMRLNPSHSPPPPSDLDNPFVDDDTTTKPKQSAAKIDTRKCVALDGLQWRVAAGMFQALLFLAEYHCRAGAPRAALLYFGKAVEMADGLAAPLPHGTALALQEELKLMCEDPVGEGFSRSDELLGQLPTAGLIEMRRIQGDQCVKEENKDLGRQIYASADTILKDLEKTYTLAMTTQKTPLKISRKRVEKPVADGELDVLLPTLQAALLRQQVWLFKEPSEAPEFEELLTRLLSLPPTRNLKAEENSLLGRVHMHDACNQFRNDLFLSSLTESIIAVPMGMISQQCLTPSASSIQVLDTLHKAEQYFADALELMLCKGRISETRSVSVNLALIHAFQTMLGKTSSNGPRLAASLLEMCAGTSLHRQMLESTDLKLQPSKHSDDLTWPSTAPKHVPAKQNQVLLGSTISDEDICSADDDDEEDLDRSYWQATRDRYIALLSDVGLQGPAQVDVLPSNWTVISINVTEDQNTILIARHRSRQEPLILCLPLDRQGKRDGEDDQFTFQSAIDELDNIIENSNKGILAAKEVAGKDATASWWSERGELDRRLGELLETIEFCWLGAFKTVLCEPPRATKESLKSLRNRLEKIFQGAIKALDKNSPASRTRLHDNILDCFASLSTKCRDEELEDMIYFVLDLYHFHGIPVAVAEIDVDMLVVDIRSALEEFAANPPVLCSSQADPHLFLILDKNVQGIPWESIPILRGRSVSRIPSISFLVDRIELSRHRRGPETEPTASPRKIDRVVVDPRRAFYMLNVSRDLTRTEQQFSPWLKEMDQIGWRGIIGRPPMAGEMLRALESSELVLYFGHGGGEQYVRSQQIRRLSRCASVMLWGCSSGALRSMGEFDRFGTPHNYMLAGCPNVVATLWDVTDRDIDRFSDSVFKKMHLDRAHVETWSASQPSMTSIVAAVAQSRDVCKLKYLNGAAPVVYGIPYYL
ncbi:hypothetical protein DACRYDRAFT_116022 [Dacryopinax primogenitus]|uniref:separase n=1 Tax=Dacryopinax primogenitus (strain DJM 731) TaxID=1858805 RepID=M5FWI3_DACPD|nr:uncharacterized protein DACRYDRAFT_116022 [Dacryopinax primogenitus]EJU02296.1 hypothetical protein DACRYDRAFT_116022 [Dacryopinax primogenitus]